MARKQQQQQQQQQPTGRLLVFLAVLVMYLLHHTHAKIIQVQFVSRHCDRTPVSNMTIPVDPVNWEEYLGMPRGELTGLGMNQCYRLGHSLRDHYLNRDAAPGTFIHEISETYFPFDYKFYSSHVDRTLISAWSTAMGLFDKSGPVNDIDNEPALPNQVQPIPVHEIESKHDNILRAYDKCPQIDKWKEEYHASEEYKKIEEAYKPLMEKVLVAAGFDKDAFDLNTFYQFYDLVVVQHSHKRLKDKNLLAMYDDIIKLGGVSTTNSFNRKVQGKLGGGPNLQIMLDYLAKMVEADKAGKSLKTYKFIQYSGHDTTIMSLLAALNLLEDHKVLQTIPPYGSQVLFELHKDGEDKYSVQVIVRHGYEGEFKPYELKSLAGGCDGQVKCPFDKFSKMLLKEGIPDNWCKSCGNTAKDTCVKELLADKQLETIILYVIIPVLIAFNAVTFIILIAYFIKNRFFGKKETSGGVYSVQLP